jgi:uncharacterized membrane protein
MSKRRDTLQQSGKLSPSIPSPGGQSGVIRVEQQIQQSESFQGPIPPPGILAQYDEIVPGAAERIITLMEKQAAHRMHLERTVIESDVRRANWGVAAAVVITIVSLTASVFLVVAGYSAGVWLGAVNLVALASVFIYGTSMRRQERASKQQVTQGIRGKKQ